MFCVKRNQLAYNRLVITANKIIQSFCFAGFFQFIHLVMHTEVDNLHQNRLSRTKIHPDRS